MWAPCNVDTSNRLPYFNYKPSRFVLIVAQRGSAHCTKGSTPTLGIFIIMIHNITNFVANIIERVRQAVYFLVCRLAHEFGG